MVGRPRYGSSIRPWGGWLAVIVAVNICGCESGGLPGTIPVGGKVLYQGEPVSQGTVLYSPVDTNSGRLARGALQADGSFELTTLKSGDGALPGEYRVSVLSYKPHPGEPGRGGVDADSPPPEIVREHYVPARYTDPEQSGLRDTVDENHPGYKVWELED